MRAMTAFLLAAGLTLAFDAAGVAQMMQVEGPPINRWQTLKPGSYVLILRKGTVPGLSSTDGSSRTQKPILFVNYRTSCKVGQKKEMVAEATQIIPGLKADLATGQYGGVMICPFQGADNQPPLEMFMFNRDKKGTWHKAP